MILATIENNSRHTKKVEAVFEDKYDVVIVGGGTSSVMTALTLGKQNHKVLLLEKLNKLGGTLTHSVFGYYYGSEGGYFEQIDKEIKQLEQQPYLIGGTESYLFNPLVRANVYERELRKAKVEIVFSARIEGVYLAGDTVNGIRYLHNGKLICISCRYLVDGTAEAYVAELAGAKVVHGREFDASTQPFSQTATYFDPSNLSIATNNIDSGYIKQTDQNDYAEKIIASGQGKQLLKENYKDGSVMLFMSPLLGVREGNCIVGRKQLKFDEVIRGIETSEPIFYTYSHVDNHGKDIAFESQAQNDWMTAMNLWAISFSAGISIDMLLPVGVSRCIVAGRHFSRDHDMCAHSRMNRDMQKLGEAVAAVIAVADQQQCELHEVNHQDVVEVLKQTNCFTEANHVGTTDIPSHTRREIQTAYPKSADEIRMQLVTEKPGLGILAALRSNMAMELRGWLREDNCELCFNSAIALALLGHNDGAYLLLGAAEKHESKRSKTSRKYNAPRGVTAIYLLGRLAYLPSLPVLLDLLKRNKSLYNDSVEFDDLISNMDDYCFQYVSHLIRALSSIARTYPSARSEVLDTIQKVVFCTDFKMEIPLKVSGQVDKNTFDMTARIREYVCQAFDVSMAEMEIQSKRT